MLSSSGRPNLESLLEVLELLPLLSQLILRLLRPTRAKIAGSQGSCKGAGFMKGRVTGVAGLTMMRISRSYALKDAEEETLVTDWANKLCSYFVLCASVVKFNTCSIFATQTGRGAPSVRHRRLPCQSKAAAPSGVSEQKLLALPRALIDDSLDERERGPFSVRNARPCGSFNALIFTSTGKKDNEEKTDVPRAAPHRSASSRA